MYTEDDTEAQKTIFKYQFIMQITPKHTHNYIFGNPILSNIDLLQNRHTFYTPYAKDNWEPIKQENIKKLLTENVSLDDCTTNGPSDKTS